MAANANVNKVVYDGTVLVDLTGDTVTPADLASGVTAHDATGAQIVGEASGGGAEAAEATPSMDGTAAVGSSERYAREDHVHPTDTTRAPIDSPAFTGVPTAPTAASGTDTAQLATTAFVQDALGGVSSGGLVWKGEVNYTHDLPSSASDGDVYSVKYFSTGQNIYGSGYAYYSGSLPCIAMAVRVGGSWKYFITNNASTWTVNNFVTGSGVGAAISNAMAQMSNSMDGWMRIVSGTYSQGTLPQSGSAYGQDPSKTARDGDVALVYADGSPEPSPYLMTSGAWLPFASASSSSGGSSSGGSPGVVVLEAASPYMQSAWSGEIDDTHFEVPASGELVFSIGQEFTSLLALRTDIGTFDASTGSLTNISGLDVSLRFDNQVTFRYAVFVSNPGSSAVSFDDVGVVALDMSGASFAELTLASGDQGGE